MGHKILYTFGDPKFITSNSSNSHGATVYDDQVPSLHDFPFMHRTLTLALIIGSSNFGAPPNSVLEYIKITDILYEIDTGVGDDRYFLYDNYRINIGDKIFANDDNDDFEHGPIVYYNEHLALDTTETIRIYFKIKLQGYSISNEVYVNLRYSYIKRT